MKEITWKTMIALSNIELPEFKMNFTLLKPEDVGQNIAFCSLDVIRFECGSPVVSCDGEEWNAVKAVKVFCEIV